MSSEKELLFLISSAKRLHPQKQFGKTAFVKILYLAQELFDVDFDYSFELYTWGPFDSQILYDLDKIAAKDKVTVERIEGGYGYDISVNDECDYSGDIEPSKVEALETVIREYGSLSAKDLELLTTLLYVHRTGRITGEELYSRVRAIKPKYTRGTIKQAALRLDSLIK